MMDADGAGEFYGWEVLQSNSDSESSVVTQNLNDFEATEAHSEGMIQTDYFSADHTESRRTRVVVDVSEVGSENSDNPSWIDPRLDAPFPRKDTGEGWPDSGSDRSDDRKSSELEGNTEVGSNGNGKFMVDFEGIEEIQGGNEKKLETFEKFLPDSGGIELGSLKVEDSELDSQMGSAEIANSEAVGEEKRQIEEQNENEGGSVGVETRKVEQKDEEKKSMVWWKVPIDILRYCVFRASPVWTFSVAAAVMGLVILGRRLYKMNKKTRGLELKVTMDDKKISQFMSRAARLNEAFSVVKRVPVIRPSLPAVGVTPWPVMGLR